MEMGNNFVGHVVRVVRYEVAPGNSTSVCELLTLS
jgi:hypothetical protein